MQQRRTHWTIRRRYRKTRVVELKVDFGRLDRVILTPYLYGNKIERLPVECARGISECFLIFESNVFL